MKLSEQKVDPVRREQGGWVDKIPDWEDLRLHVRGVGNRDWRRLQAQLIAAVPQNKKLDGLEPEEQDKINVELIVEAGLLGWENLDGEDEPIVFSKDAARTLLLDPENTNFRDACMWACATVARKRAARVEGAAKN